MAIVFDRVGMSTTTAGVGTLTLGSALGNVSPNLAAFVSFASAGVANGQLVSYLILDSNNNWEVLGHDADAERAVVEQFEQRHQPVRQCAGLHH